MAVFKWIVRWTLNYEFVVRSAYNLTKKRIVLLFKTNRSFGTMTGVHGAVTRQGKQFFPDVSCQRFKISAGEIPAPDTPAEKHIAADKEIISFVIKTKMRRRMAWREY